MVERHAFVEVIGSSPILVLFYFFKSILGKEIFKNVVKNLSLSDLELILCDWYEMDEQLPNPIFEKKEFERVSNGLWAIRNYPSGWTDLYSFCATGSFNHRLYLWGKHIKSKETSIFDECLRHA